MELNQIKINLAMKISASIIASVLMIKLGKPLHAFV